MKLIILSDIHGNLSALQRVVSDFSAKYTPDGVILLGDNINYGMRSNEVIEFINQLEYPIIASLYGNHEKAVIDGDTSRFSTKRGGEMLRFTASILNEQTLKFIKEKCVKEGFLELCISGKKILLIHGTLEDSFWGKMNEDEIENTEYSKYDLVLSGHSHVPHLIEKFYKCDLPSYRNKKRTVFINPGSVGQPRNHNPKAQYVFMDFENETIHFNSVSYNIEEEQSLYPNYLDSFYSKRLTNGI